MKAYEIAAPGGSDVLRQVDRADPIPGPGQIIVNVEMAGVNYSETQIREGTIGLLLPFPIVPGLEAAGVVAGHGSGVAAPPLGSRVVVLFTAQGTYRGGYAEKVVADERAVFPIPDEVSYADALALLAQGLTAHFILHDVAPPKDCVVLVLAAAGGVGILAVQLAKLYGATQVIGAAGPTKLERLSRLGVDHPVDYTKAGWAQQVRDLTGGHGADIVIDPVGGQIGAEGLSTLAPLGRFIFYGALSSELTSIGGPEMSMLMANNLHLIGFGLPNYLRLPGKAHEGVVSQLSLVASGKLKPLIHPPYAFADARQMHDDIVERRTAGKVVLMM